MLSRFATEKQTRSMMVAVLARQCERYRDMHLAWQAQRQEAKACMDKLNEQVPRDKR